MVDLTGIEESAGNVEIRNVAKAPPAPRCERCQALERQLDEAQRGLVAALMEVGQERARANALILAFPPPIPLSIHEGADLPLRYQLADKVNRLLKSIPLVHAVAKRVSRGLYRLTQRTSRR